MELERVEPPFAADERETLDGWLEYHRATLELKCSSLSAAQLAERSVPPSTLSLLGLVRHMAEVERNWFRRVFAGEEDAGPIFYSDDDPDGDFDNVDPGNVAEGFATWHEEMERAREIAADASLDARSVGTSRGEAVSLRWIITHMIEEYARHNGHADLLRERIDGETGD
ncbi:MAG TPA: DinB family protein [Acidimicrobiia bacterium]|jgi:uncharacterized damage-inducible protein DinB